MHFALGTINTPKSEALSLVLASSPYTRGASFSNHRVSSGVPDMPTTLGELRTGAKNRAVFTRRDHPEADYSVGMEGGVYRDSEGEEYWLVGVTYIEDRDGIGYYGYSNHLRLPERIIEGLFDGRSRDLEAIVEDLYGHASVGDAEGSFGLFSEGTIPRSIAFAESIRSALVPHFSQYYR